MFILERYVLSSKSWLFVSLFHGKELFCLRLNSSHSGGRTLEALDPNTSKAIPKQNTLDLILNASNLREEWSDEELRLKEKAERENAWTPVYRNQGLFKFFVVLRLNSIMFFGSYTFLCYAIFQQLSTTGVVDLLTISPQIGMAMVATFVNFLIKKQFARVVGVISVDNESRTIYRIGHFSKFGFRQNKFARLGDVKDLTDSNSTGVGIYSKLCWTFRPKEYLLIPTIGCEIVDEQAANLLLGNLEHFKYLPEPNTSPETEIAIDAGYTKRLDVPKPNADNP
ncbi:hypothetical protein ACQ4LE_002506 [Meloidogyne hapla]